MKLRPRSLDLSHEGHPGIVLMKYRLRSTTYWPGMDKEVEDRVRNCLGCQSVAQPDAPEPMIRLEFPNRPWSNVAVDIMGPLPWNASLLVCTCFRTRWFEVMKLKKSTATEIIENLTEIFARSRRCCLISYETDSDRWKDLQHFLAMHRNTPHSSTGKTPSEIMINRVARGKIPAIVTSSISDERVIQVDRATKASRKR